jgi:DNA repair protein RecO (recombination protein O)
MVVSSKLLRIISLFMRSSQTTPAIVLRARPYGESDKIVSFLTENFGKLTGIAKGALRSRRRFMNSLEPFTLVRLHFHERAHSNLVFIVGADLLVGFPGLTASLERLSYAAYLVEITEGLISEREENLSIFQHLRDSLRYLEGTGSSLRFLTHYELKLLHLAGYRPALDDCKRCGKVRHAVQFNQWHFSPADGGVLCESCSRMRREVLPLDHLAADTLSMLQADVSDLGNRVLLPSAVIRQMRTVLLRFIQYQIDREIKSAAFLTQFSEMEKSAT